LKNQTTNAEKTILAMEKIFVTHGIPDEILTDNGPPFNSQAFKTFFHKVGFHHRKITPLATSQRSGGILHKEPGKNDWHSFVTETRLAEPARRILGACLASVFW
jgi:hypothetical protein